jgi:hypothetical protein
MEMAPQEEPFHGSPVRAHGAALLVLLALTVGFFSPYLFQGKVFLAADTLAAYLPWSAAAPPGFQPKNTLITDPVNANYAGIYNEQLKSGGLRHWNPFILTGLPSTGVTSMSGGAPGRYSPLKLLLHRALPPLDAFMWLLILNVFLAGAFQYAYLREIGCGWAGALFGGVAFMFNGYALVWLEFESVTAVAPFLPLLLLIMERYRRRPAWYALLGALVLGALALTAMIQYLIYVALFLLAYVAFLLARSWRERRDPGELRAILLAFCATCALGAAIGAVELLPSLDLIRHSSRIARAFTFASFFETLGRVPWRYFVTLIFPDFFGSPVLGFSVIPRLPTQEYMNYNELCLYLGLPTLFALLALPLRPLRSHAALYLGLLAAAVLLLTGTVLYYPLFALFPGMDRMNPTRLIFLFVFIAASGAGLGLDGLLALPRRRLLAFSALALALCGATAALAAAGGSSRALGAWFGAEYFAGGANPAVLDQILRLRSWPAALVLKPVLLAAASAALALAYAWVRPRGARWSVLALLVVLLGYDLGSFGWGYNAIVEPQQVYPRTPALDFVARQPGPFRVVLDGRQRFLINTLAPYGIQEVGGYSSFYPEAAGRYLSYMAAGEASLRGWRFDRWVSFAGPNQALLSLANVRYLLTAPWTAVTEPNYRLVFRQELAVYENVAALPRAFVVHRARVVPDVDQALRLLGAGGVAPAAELVLERPADPGFLAGVREGAGPDRVSFERYETDRADVLAELGAAGWLVVSDAWDPGWRAEVDGRPVAIERADVCFRAVPLGPGRHRVVFTYVPRAYRLGLLVALAALALVAAGLIREHRRRRGLPPG